MTSKGIREDDSLEGGKAWDVVGLEEVKEKVQERAKLLEAAHQQTEQSSLTFGSHQKDNNSATHS